MTLPTERRPEKTGPRGHSLTHSLARTFTYSRYERAARFDGTARPVEALALEIVNLLLVGLLLITRSVVGSFCELLEVMLYEDK